MGAALHGQPGKRLFLPQEMRMTFYLLFFVPGISCKNLKMKDACYVKLFQTGKSE